MSARDVIAGAVVTGSNDVWAIANKVLRELGSAGFTPPMHTGAVHKALQDAFQAGVNEAFAGRYIRPSSDLVALKHKICDGILTELTAAKEAVTGGNACQSLEHAVPETTPKGEQQS